MFDWCIEICSGALTIGHESSYSEKAPHGKQNTLPTDAVCPMIEKNICPMVFTLGGNLDRVPGALKELFKFAIDGSVKVEITRYPLAEASTAHAVFEGRKTWGKHVVVP